MSNSLNVNLEVSLFDPLPLEVLSHQNVIECFVELGVPIPIPIPILQNQLAELPFTRSHGNAEVIIPQGQGICPVCGDIVYVLKNGTPNPVKHKCH
jgi:hypothetical protein